MEPHVLAELIRHTLEEGGSFRLPATGNSMFPTLRSGLDAVELVKPGMGSGERRIAAGEIVLFRRTGQPPEKTYVLHRIRRIRKNGRLVMNGDGQRWMEEIDPGQVIGVAARIYRGRRVISCASLPYRGYVFLWSLSRPAREWLAGIYLKGTDGRGRRS